MKFNNLNELRDFATTMARSPTGKVLQAHVQFKIAYVEFCKRKGVPVSRYAKDIGVAGSTPYSWIELYDKWLASEPKEATEPKEEPVTAGNPINVQAIRDEIARLSEILKCVETLKAHACTVFKLEG